MKELGGGIVMEVSSAKDRATSVVFRGVQEIESIAFVASERSDSVTDGNVTDQLAVIVRLAIDAETLAGVPRDEKSLELGSPYAQVALEALQWFGANKSVSPTFARLPATLRARTTALCAEASGVA